MTQFELKTAIIILPVVDDTEDKINQLIDAIKLYNDTLDEAGKKSLVTFVFKTRLSTTAKLRLEATYTSVELLVKDMKTRLLRSKSDSVLQLQLSNAKQSNKSIEQFGTELENLFVKLTIAQAKDN